MWCQMANSTVDEIVLNRVLIKMKNPDDEQLRTEIMLSLKENLNEDRIDITD